MTEQLHEVLPRMLLKANNTKECARLQSLFSIIISMLAYVNDCNRDYYQFIELKYKEHYYIYLIK